MLPLSAHLANHQDSNQKANLFKEDDVHPVVVFTKELEEKSED